MSKAAVSGWAMLYAQIKPQGVCPPFYPPGSSANKQKDWAWPELISQNSLSSSFSFQHKKPWRSYVMTQKENQVGGLVSRVYEVHSASPAL